ncbi:MAG: ABC transporter substrate-binding protein [Thermoanaerobaculales bacterium]
MTKSLPLIAALLVMDVAAGGALGCTRAGQRSAADRVRVSYTPYLSYAPLFLAADEGLFRRHGLDVELIQMSVYDSTAALLHGDVDVATNFLSIGVLTAIARGGRLQIVADKGYEAGAGCACNALFARRELVASGRLTDLVSLRGLRVGVRRVTVEEYWLDRLLESAGVPWAEIRVTDVPAEGKLTALASGQVDLVAWSEPSLTQAAAKGLGVVWKRPADVLPDLQWAYLLYGRSLLDQRPDVGRRFMLAYLEGVRRYSAGKTDRNVASVARHTGIDPELVRRACWIAIHQDGRINTASVLDFERWAKSKGYLDAVVPELRFWNPAFTAWASAQLAAGGS